MKGITRTKGRSRTKCHGRPLTDMPLFERRACDNRAEWQLSPESHRWCLACALDVLDDILSPPFERGGYCPLAHQEWWRAHRAKEAAVA